MLAAVSLVMRGKYSLAEFLECLTCVTTFGLAKNKYAGDVPSEATLDDLFS